LLRAFVSWLHEQGYAKSTVARRLAAVRSFGKYLCRQSVLTVNPAQGLRGPRQDKKLPHFLTVADVQILLAAPSDAEAVFRYRMHTLPSEIGDRIGTSTLFAAWNAVIYVNQVEDEKLERPTTPEEGARTVRSIAHMKMLQSLSGKLNRLNDVRQIGLTIANELRSLIDYHNCRVFVVDGEDVVPVAFRGELAGQETTTLEVLACKLGDGITGRVAQTGEPCGEETLGRRADAVKVVEHAQVVGRAAEREADDRELFRVGICSDQLSREMATDSCSASPPPS